MRNTDNGYYKLHHISPPNFSKEELSHMAETTNHPPSQQRTSTGISGLDAILGGGLFVGSHYLIIGPPGAGKTIIANQLCFHHVATGGRAIYVSLLAETNSRLLTHLQPLTFFTPTPIG